MILVSPPTSDIINVSATATNASLYAVPANRWFSADVQLSAIQSGAGTATPNVTWTATGSGFAPASGSTLARIVVGGILGVISGDSDTTEILVYGGDSGGTIGFTASGTSSSVTINGFLN
jgi:hypothetical protein